MVEPGALRSLVSGLLIDTRKEQAMIRLTLNFGLIVALHLASSLVRAHSLELTNGHLIHGNLAGGTDSEISFQVGGLVEQYSVHDVAAIRFDSHGITSNVPMGLSTRFVGEPETIVRACMKTTASSTIPAGTHAFVRTNDSANSALNQVGDHFQSPLEEPLMHNGNLVAPEGTEVYGLTESKKLGTFTGRSELRLEQTGIVVNGNMVPALGSIIGPAAGRGKGAAIGACTGAGLGEASEIVTKGDQVKVPSETLLYFTRKQGHPECRNESW